MNDVTIMVNGVPRRVPGNWTVAVALLQLGVVPFERDSHGAGRAPVCGMGTCHECRVTIDGVPGVRSCLEPVRGGMQVETGR